MTWDGTERRHNHYHCQEEIVEKLDRVLRFIEGDEKQPGAKILLDRHERVLKVVVWAGALLVLSSLGFAGWMTQQAFAKVFVP